MSTEPWRALANLCSDALAYAWVSLQVDLLRAPNTVAAYARGLDHYLGFCRRMEVSVTSVGSAQIAAYVRELAGRSVAWRYLPAPLPLLPTLRSAIGLPSSGCSMTTWSKRVCEQRTLSRAVDAEPLPVASVSDNAASSPFSGGFPGFPTIRIGRLYCARRAASQSATA